MKESSAKDSGRFCGKKGAWERTTKYFLTIEFALQKSIVTALPEQKKQRFGTILSLFPIPPPQFCFYCRLSVSENFPDFLQGMKSRLAGWETSVTVFEVMSHIEKGRFQGITRKKSSSCKRKRSFMSKYFFSWVSKAMFALVLHFALNRLFHLKAHSA